MRDVAVAVVTADGAEPVDEELARVWCLIHEVPDGNRGVGAAPVRLRDLADRFGAAAGTQRSAELRFDQR